MPRVTVCIPTYRRTRWLAATIESVLAQTFGDLAIEVHDDATPSDAVARVAARYPGVRYVRYETNAGIVGNFSRSLLAARTEYVLQLGDDDEADPRLVEATVRALDAHPSAGMAHARFTLVDEAGDVMVGATDWLGTPSPPLEPGADFVARSIDHGCRVCSSTALIRRAAVPDGAFREEDFPQFDFAFWLRMAEAWDVAFVDEPLCRYRIHGESHTSATSELTGTGYLQAERTLREVHAVKRRFLAGLEPGPRREALERAADRALRRDVVGRIRERTLPDRPFGQTARALGRAARREPLLLREPTAWALLAGSVLGPRAVERLKGRA